MTPKQFLEEECENVGRTLKETLRHDYGLTHTKDYYEECASRLTVLKGYVAGVADNDVAKLVTLSRQLSGLSDLISRIERSHLGEFSWPFANELRNLAEVLLSEPVRSVLNPPPIIHIFSEGGLSSYRIYPEGKKAAIQPKQRIITIVFPRTLKHHVLFHSIFGHEIGHAAWEVDTLQASLSTNVLAKLQSIGSMANVTTANSWFSDSKAPTEFLGLKKEFKAIYGVDPSISSEQLEKWLQEFMCDLFGLVTFGPCFLAAHRALLNALDPLGYYWGDNHPPYVCRRHMLVRACNYLGWNAFAVADPKIVGPLKSFWGDYGSISGTPAWVEAFDDNQIQQAVDGLKTILTSRGFPIYSLPTPEVFEKLVSDIAGGIPPHIGGFDSNDKVFNSPVDFRDILFAGWVAWSGREEFRTSSGDTMPFLIVNRLCDLAILQQQAVKIAAGTG